MQYKITYSRFVTVDDLSDVFYGGAFEVVNFGSTKYDIIAQGDNDCIERLLTTDLEFATIVQE